MRVSETRREAAHELQLLTVTEVCEQLQISRWTFYRLVHLKELKTVTIGRSRRVSSAAIADFIRQRESSVHCS